MVLGIRRNDKFVDLLITTLMPLMGLVWMTCCLSGLLAYSPGLGNASIALRNPLSLQALSGLSHRWDRPHRLVRGGNASVKKHRPRLKFQGASREHRLFANRVQTSDRPGKHRRDHSRDSQIFTTVLNWDNRPQKGKCTVDPPVTNSSPSKAVGQQNFRSTPQDLPENATLISSGPSQKSQKSTPGMGQLLSNFFPQDSLDLEPQPSLDPSVQVKAVTVTPGPSRPMTRVNWWQSRYLFGLGKTVSWSSEKTPKQIVFRKPSEFQAVVQGYEVAQLPDRIQADLFAHRIQDWLDGGDRDPAQLTPTTLNGMRAIQGGDRTLLLMSEEIVESIPRNQDLLTVEWTNNLRKALGAEPLPIADAQAQMYGLVETPRKLQGTASWYGPYFHGRLTANGETYNQEDMTAAHPSLPFDTYLKVKNLQNGKMVIVRINDRGPYIPPRNLDLSLGAARVLGSEETGVISYEATFMKPTPSKVK
jgi:rare lipoprotein A